VRQVINVSLQTCPDNQTLSDLLDESLDQSSRQTICDHIQKCIACQETLDRLTTDPNQPLLAPKSTDAPSLEAFVDRMRKTLPRDQFTRDEREPEITFPIGPTADAPLGKISHYVILAKVASGAHGVLYRARDESLQRIVALKVLRSDLSVSSNARTRILREAQVVASLVDDHIVPIYEIGNEPNFPPYLVMEFVEGETLAELIAREQLVPERQAAKITIDVLSGLRTLHSQGMIHRDVKPSNILLDTRTNRARITDFGLARQETNASLLTIEGTLAGTPAYMSPEQIQSPGSVDARSDLYSAGVALYEMLTGQVPYQGSVRATLSQVLHDEARPVRALNEAVSRDLETITMRAISKNPAVRFHDAQEFIDELNRWLKKMPIRSRPVSQAELYWRFCQRNPVVTGLATLVLLSLLTVATVSIIAARRMAEANRRSEHSALLASEQRDAALKTLGKLVNEVQHAFDREEIDLDELQQEVLEVALNGLSSIKNVGDDSREAELHRADALRRMSDILYRLDKDESATEGLYQAENILRELSRENPNDAAIKGSLAETLWALAALPDQDDARNLERLREALELIQQLSDADRSRKSQMRLAKARYLLADELRLQGDLGGASEMTALALPIFQSNHSQINELTETPSYLDALLLQSQIFLGEGQFEDAQTTLRELVDRSEASVSDEHLNIDFAEYRLLGLYLLGYAFSDPSTNSEDAKLRRNEFAAFAKAVKDRATADSDSFEEAMLLLTNISTERQQEDDIQGAILFDRIALDIAESWLTKNPKDIFAIFHQAQRYIAIAEFQFDLKADRQVVEPDLKKGIELARACASRSQSDDTDWELFIESCALARDFYDDWGNAAESGKYILEANTFLEQLSKRFPAIGPDWLQTQQQLLQE
jgi:Protein kinase domain